MNLTLAERFKKRLSPATESGCWLWKSSRNRFGYGQIFVNGKMKKAHRVSWNLHRGEIPAGLCVLHKCDIPACVNPDHLFLGTLQENNADRCAKGRSRGGRKGGSAKGEHNGRAKLSNADVDAIRSSTDNARQIADSFGVSVSAIYQIRRKAIWADQITGSNHLESSL